ncbi:copper resistance protein [Bacillus paramycoides]|uniref:Copper resistance protein n=1 Tax=Bacillus paramycoides TaxID=2026194 RepID=A0ABU6N264_9BACI|nr:copper resistance protein [Bacillus paramycoides]
MKLQINELYNLLDTFKERELSIGYSVLIIYSNDALEKEQLGYSIDNKGNSLIGTNKGDWRQSWFVIGHEEEYGNPIFVDMSRRYLPVYTAEHGEGEWNPRIVSSSLKGFIKTSNYLYDLSKGRETPIENKDNALSVSDKAKLLTKIIIQTKRLNIRFWLGYFLE